MTISQRQMAKALGVRSKRTIEKRISQGMPMNSIEAASAWCAKNLAETRGSGLATEAATGSQGSQGDEGSHTVGPPESDGDQVGVDASALPDQKTLNRMLTAVRIKLTSKDTAIRHLQERQAQLDADLRDGRLRPAEDVRRVNAEAAVALRDRLLALPAELAVRLAAMTEPAEVAALLRGQLKGVLVDWLKAIGAIDVAPGD